MKMEKNKITFEDIKKANESIMSLDIKGKEYAQVNERIKVFRMLYPEGTIQTEMLSNENGVCVFKASVLNGDLLLGTGTAYEKEGSTFINKTSYIENCETSAVGRALAMCGVGIDTSIASAEEVQNAIENQKRIEKEEEEDFKDHNKYEMQLDKLIEDNNLDYDKVCALWKVKDIHKMNTKDLKYSIDNFEELKKKVA